MISAKTTPFCIELQDVCLAFSDRQIFSNFNLTISKEEKILVSGKSGVGKTTLFKLLLGFEQPNNGSVFINGNPVKPEHINTIRSRIFYLSQDIDFRNETVSVLLDEIFMANQCQPEPSEMNEMLSFLELRNTLMDQPLEKLSGGERQRLGLLTCFLLDRPIWLLDEPTAALDDTMKHRVVNHILEQKKTIVVISHDNAWKNHDSVRVKRIE